MKTPITNTGSIETRDEISRDGRQPMEFTLNDRLIRTFTISPRTLDKVDYWGNIQRVVDWSEKFGCTGVLLFEGNDTYVNPWLAAQETIAKTDRLCPLIAVNPVYMHPFTAAKMVSSFVQMFGRKIYLNMITGTALSYLEALNEQTSHDDRYDKLREYTEIVMALLESTKPLNYSGKYYTVSNLMLQPGIPKELLPEILLSGQSDAARKICRELKAIGLQMLQPDFEESLEETGSIHFGIITREDESEAWDVAYKLVPNNEEDQEILDMSMKNTDSVWKRRMRLAADEPDRADTGYWLQPFRNFRADCAYIVGDYQRIADVFVRLIRGGIDVFVLDIQPQEEEFEHISRAFDIARQQLQEAEQQHSTSN